jgi:hypothetical protein
MLAKIARLNTIFHGAANTCMWAFLISFEFGSNLAMLMWRKNDAFNHFRALAGTATYGLLAIGFLGSTFVDLSVVTGAVELPYLKATQKRIRWIAALISCVAIACISFFFVFVYLKRFGVLRPTLSVLYGMLIVFGAILSRHKLKRLHSDLGLG